MKLSQAVARLLATWFGCGYFPWGPGTIGSAAAIAIACWVHWYAGVAPWWFAVIAVILSPLAIWAAGREARSSGRTDPGHIVIDEVVGQWITLAPATVLDVRSILIAFALFRFLDIVKPPPVRNLEALPGGTGIMADDIMAGVYGGIVMLILRSVNF